MREGDLNILKAMRHANSELDFNIADNDDVSPLHIAAEKGYYDIVNYLCILFKSN